MALKQVMLNHRLEKRRAELKKLEDEREKLKAEREALEAREAQLASAAEELDAENPDEEAEASVNAEVEKFEADAEDLKNREKANADAVSDLEREIEGVENELKDLNERAEKTQTAKQPEERSMKAMQNQNFEERAALVAREDVKAYLGEVRSAIREKRAITNAGLLIPEVMLGLIRHEIARASKLLPYVNVRAIGGEGRQNIAGAIPEAVWTEMCASINELTLSFNQVEVDGYKVGGYIAICNAVLEDSDIDLANEIVTSIGGAIGKALDKAILFGTGTKMPTGIVTRLAQTTAPENWGSYAPAWTDLHETNVLTLNINSASGVEFFSALIEKLAVAKDWYNAGGLFWVMNRKTHLHLLAKALAFNSNAALVSNTDMMPIIGGAIVEFEDDQIADNEIIGGFGGNYLLAQRAGVKFASSDIPLFLQDQTVFKGTARYDGKPVAGEAFVIVNFANTSPTTSAAFPEDYANADMNDLVITAAAGSAAGKTVLTVSGTLAQSNPKLYYKLGDYSFKVGAALPSGFETLTSGSTAITAAAGKKITVVELDGSSRIVSEGVVVSVPKAS